MDESEILNRLCNEGIVIPFMVGTFIVLGILIGTIGKTIRFSARERTRREIAAFISEGSMTPEQGERLLKAGSKDIGCA